MKKLPVPISFVWDLGNEEKNWKKHKVHYREAEEVFFNQPSEIFPDVLHSKNEKRFIALGETNKARQLTVVFTIRREKIRVISARAMNKKERNIYEKKV